MQLEQERLGKIDQISKRRPKAKKAAKKDDKKGDNLRNLDFHRLEWSVLYKRFGINEEHLKTGFTTAAAEAKNQEVGDNTLSERKKTHWSIKLLHEWTSPFALMLWAGSGLCFLSYFLDPSDASNLYLGIVLAGVVALTGIVTFIQNAQSESLMDSFKDMIPPECSCLRNGKYDKLNAKKLVPGDIIKVRDGDKIPADIRIIEAKEMRVDNSSLTGESDPLLRSPECDSPQKILETKNVAFFGTLCKTGNATGIVCQIGDDTVIGQIAGLAESAEAGLTPIRKELNAFIKMITIIALTLGVVFFIGGFILGYGPIQNLVFAIGIIVANVPEGLLATITVSLSVAARKLARKKVLVKNLESVETLGSTNCICSDKTGTLTQNKMTIENIFYNQKVFHADNLDKKGKNFKFDYNRDSIGFTNLRECAVTNCVAEFSSALPKKYITLLESFEGKSNYDQKKR